MNAVEKESNPFDSLANGLLVVGGLNWALVGLFKFDLVAALTGNRFGRTNRISSVIYDLVGLSALYKLFSMAQPSEESPVAGY